MKKLKNFYKNNRIYCILMLVSLVCLVAMGTGVVVYFINQATSSNYGKRLEGIDSYPVSSDIDKLKDYFKNTEKVIDSNVRLQGKIIYVDITVEKELKNETIEGIATESLDKVSDENKSFYDIQFIVKREGLVPFLGSKSSANTVISWNNYSFDEEEKKDKEAK